MDYLLHESDGGVSLWLKINSSLLSSFDVEPAESAGQESAEPSSNGVLAAAMSGFTEAITGMQRARQITRGPDGRATGIV